MSYTMLNGNTAIKLEAPLYKYLEVMDTEAERIALAQAAITHPLQYFCPNGKQEEFIRTVALSSEYSKIPTILFTAANGIGKTTASLNIVANIIYGAQNGWFDYEMFHKFPFPKLCWYITTRSAIENVIIKALSEMLPPNTYAFDKRGKPYISAVHFKNGWELVFFTQDQDTKEMESATVGLIVGDEPFTQEIWKVIKSRRRMGCLTILPMTPLEVEPFIIDEVDKYAKEGRRGFYRITSSVYEACKKRGVRGHLDPDIIDQMVDDYDEDERQSRVYGEFMYFSERIYKLEPKHWVNPEDYPLITGFNSRVRNYQVNDPADGRPCAIIWAQKYPIQHSPEYKLLIAKGEAKQQVRTVVFYESPVEVNVPFWELKYKETAEESVEKWIEIERMLLDEYGVKPTDRILDRRFGWQTRNSSTIANSYAEAGRKRGSSFLFRSSYATKGQGSEIAFGHNAVREALQDLEDGKPGLVFWNTTWHVWNGMNHYVRKRAKNSDTDKAIGETKIIEKYKDFPDVVRYLICDKVFMVDDEPKKEEQYHEPEHNYHSIVGNLGRLL